MEWFCIYKCFFSLLCCEACCFDNTGWMAAPDAESSALNAFHLRLLLFSARSSNHQQEQNDDPPLLPAIQRTSSLRNRPHMYSYAVQGVLKPHKGQRSFLSIISLQQMFLRNCSKKWSVTVIGVPSCFSGLGSGGDESLCLVHLIFHITAQLFDFETMAGAHTKGKVWQTRKLAKQLLQISWYIILVHSEIIWMYFNEMNE